MEACELCRKPATKANRLNNHHVQGIKVSGEVMRVHEFVCHQLADAVTSWCRLNKVICTKGMIRSCYYGFLGRL